MEYYKEEIEEHNTEQSCWVIYDNFVYDITTYIHKHPGGRSLLMKYAGRDITAAYNQSYHSEIADMTMFRYKIGKLKN